MPDLTPPTDARTALLIAGAIGLASFAGFLALAATGGDVAPRFDMWYLIGFVGLFIVGTVIVPATSIYLYLRYGLVSPVVVLIADVAFWLIVVPTVGTTDGSTLPFVVLYWPAYLALYAIVAGVERWFRTSGGSPVPG